jgi:selenocysteine lyase/cysteine desulfurase
MSDGPRRFDRVGGLRDVLTATGAGIYLATHVSGPIPAETMAAVHESDDMELRVGRAGPDRADDLEQREREARAVAAAVLKAAPDRMALTHGTAEAARLVAIELLDAKQDARRVVLLEGLDKRIAGAIREVADIAAATVDVLPSAPQILAADVALLAMAHVDRDGNLAAVAPVAEAAHKAGARLLVDASLSVGALPTDVDEMGADVVVADCQRWLLGPDAVAFAWFGRRFEQELPEWLRQASAPFGRGALLSLARSVGWLLMFAELPWVIDRTIELADQLYADLAAIEGVELLADPAAHGPVAAFRISDWDAEGAADELSRSIFAIVEADTDADVLRVSVGAWNRESELARFIERVAELAAHTPESLPRRPSLTVISGPLDPEEGA